jgi:aminopeptidase N
MRFGKWKLHFPREVRTVTRQGSGGFRGDFGKAQIDWSLYDLEADPGESINLIDRHPDIAEKLKKMAAAFSSDLEAGKKPIGEYAAVEDAGADQQVFDSRSEQQLRPHDFDVKHYRIALSLEEETQSFDGETVISFSALIDGFSTLTLDAESFQVSSVTDEKGNTLDFTQGGGALVIALDRALGRNETAALTIAYGAKGIGTDKNVGLDFREKTETNPRLVNSLNWPNGARYWFPAFDHPGDWATHETIITVNDAFRVVANGSLVSDIVDPDSGLRTVHWSQTRPQPTYLYSFAAGPYSVLEDEHGSLPLHYWVYPGDEAVARKAFARTPEIIAFYEDLYGSRFPWVKYDQIIVPAISGGAESTSATLLGQRVIQYEREGDEGASDWLLAHEIAHQWWGNLIGYRDWSHNWMAESFATHGEYLFILDDLGADEGAHYLLEYKDSYLKETRDEFIRPVVTNKWDKPNDMFDRHGYEKGGVVLNMFQDLVGTETFDKILNSFLAKHAYSNVTTDDFFETVRQVTGKDYSWFFDQWLLRPGHPVLDVSYVWDERREILALTVRQTQDTSAGVPVFRLPIRVGMTTSAGKQVESVWLTEQSQTFEFKVAEQPLMVRFDEGDVLLKEWTLKKPLSELLYQVENDGAMGRIWAAGELREHVDDTAAQSALIATAIHDDFWAVRRKAIQVLGVVKDETIVDLLKARVAQDSDKRVRVAAQSALEALTARAATQ